MYAGSDNVKVRALIDGVIREKEYPSPVNALSALAELGAQVYAPCGGKGVCGKCEVHIEGEYEPFSRSGDALACRTLITGDSYIIYNTTHGKIQVLKANDMNEITPSGEESGYATAIDVGTTTVAAAVYDLRTGKLVSTSGVPNPQSVHGADIVSRMEFAANGGAETLKREIESVISSLSWSGRRVITGNTAMMCFLRGVDTSSMRAWPFETPEKFGYEEDKTYYAPCADAFFGADAVCAAAHCIKENEPCIVADIGTNGEIACWDGERIVCCSASAGPCFEGGGIERGMPACGGAVCAVRSNGTRAEYDVIDDTAPTGLCGTGIADLAAFLLEQKQMSADGLLPRTYYLAESAYITQADVRALQLAKSAVRAGIEILLERTKTRGKIQKLYLAGGFGSAVSPRTAAKLGLIPPETEEICVKAGNAALAGASRALTDGGFRKKLEETAAKCEYIHLAQNESFEKLFIKHMRFGG